MGIVLLFFQNYWIFQVKNIVQNLIHVIQYFVHFRYKNCHFVNHLCKRFNFHCPNVLNPLPQHG